MRHTFSATVYKIMNKIGNYLLFYAVALTIILFVYPFNIDTRLQSNDSTKEYVPKSKRLKDRDYGILQLMKVLNQKINVRIQNQIIKWGNTRRLKRMQRSSRLISRCYHRTKVNDFSKSIEKRSMTSLTIMPALAMQAKTSTSKSARLTSFDTDSYDIGIDNRCSRCISHQVEDFIGNLKDSKHSIRSFGGTQTTRVKVGTIQWKWMDNDGRTHTFIIPNSFYVPEGGVRLLSPQHWARSTTGSSLKRVEGAGSETLGNKVTLFWGRRRYKLTVPLCRKTNVATFKSAPGHMSFQSFCHEAELDYNESIKDPIILQPAINDGTSPKTSEQKSRRWEYDQREKVFDIQGPRSALHANVKTSITSHEADKQNLASEFLSIHQRCGHIGFDKLKEMSRQGIINRKFANAQTPACTACMYAKAVKRKWRDKTRKDHEVTSRTRPGECVSVDQLVSPTPGLVAQLTGILTTKRYQYATVYVDQASKLGFIYPQKTATAEETLESKRAFESYALQHGVTVMAYHADNGIFRANKWIDNCRQSGQTLTFAAVGAHHQNGLAERRIRTLQEMARTMLVHASIKWPAAITTHLWPYAIRMANLMINESPNMGDPYKRLPIQIFSSTTVQPNQKHWHTFGCPVYVLDRALQTNDPFHKWKRRSKVGIYLGRSPQHARNVALVLDRTTGLVSPQFHVSFDSNFDTVEKDDHDRTWQLKAGFITSSKRKPHSGTISIPSLRGRDEAAAISKARNDALRSERLQRRNTRKREADGKIKPPSEGGDRPETSQGTATLSTSEGDDRSKVQIMSEIEHTPEAYPSLPEDPIVKEITIRQMDEVLRHQPDAEDDITSLMAFKAVADPDVMYLHQAMKQPDKESFLEAMQKEVNDQSGNGNFSIIPRHEVPKGRSVLPAVWQMKRKRDIRTRQIKKYKARLNIDGSRMRAGIDYGETYAPVTSWRSIRLILSLVATNRWHTKQLDYVLAFPQAPVERELYMEVPKGFEVETGKNKDHVLKIHRNIYGQKQAGRVWNKYLADKLINKVGFKQSKIDECLFYKGKVIYALYTDDSIITGPDLHEIEQAVTDIKAAGLDVTEEGTLEDFLGVNIDRKEDGTIHLTQPHLIEQILKDLKLDGDEVKIKSTPIPATRIISHHTDSEAFDESFHYRSVIGKLNFLEKSTRPDISYTTHQCARFTSNPRKEHGKAVRWLGRYLKGTKDKGIIIKADPIQNLKMFVDADFAGNWDPKEADKRDTARSRHGYVIKYKGCPVTWKSQLQTEICLSSTESEYTGLSYALREAIPIMQTLREMKDMGIPVTSTNSEVYCTVFEDNSGAVEMANHHKYCPRTKHLNVKLHHFRDYVSRGEVKVKPISTKNQQADLLTKGLNESDTMKHRKSIMGW